MVELNQARQDHAIYEEKLASVIGPTEPLDQPTEPRNESPFNSGVSEEHKQLVESYDGIFRLDPEATSILNPFNQMIYENPTSKMVLGNCVAPVMINHIINTPIYPTEEGICLSVPDAIRAGIIRDYTSEIFTFKEYGTSYQAFVLPIQGLGPETNVRVILRDITELETLRKKNQNLEDAVTEQKRISAETASIVAHDLRNPLTVISGHSQLLIRIMEGLVEKVDKLPFISKKFQIILDSLQKINMGGLKMGEMITDTTDSLRPLDLETVTAAYLAQCIIEENAALMQSNCNIEVITRVPNEEVTVSTDLLLVARAIGSELGNSVKFLVLASREDGKITFDYRIEGGQLILFIEDNGPGMTENVRRKCFNKNFTTTGTSGLGLYGAKQRIERLGGKIWVDWTEEGKGTRFAISLPLLEKTA